MNNIHVIVPSVGSNAYWLIALLNSRLLNWYYHTLNPEIGEALAEVKKENVAALPVGFNIEQCGTTLDQLGKFAVAMIAAKQFATKCHTDQDRHIAERQIAELERKINSSVYALYQLSAKEIHIIEAPPFAEL